MSARIVTKKVSVAKRERSKIKLANQKKELSMVRNKPLLDVVTAKKRMKVPFSFKWLKFKVGFFGLVLQKGVAL
jgi:hypothetical protein